MTAGLRGDVRTPASCALAMTAALAAAPVAGAAPSPPTRAVDLSRYLGLWYEIARTPNRFEKGDGCEGATADYTQDARGDMSVVQTCHKGSANGAETVYRASARILDPGVNARFKLTFYLFLSKEYWVLDYAHDYQWAIVGDPSGRFLWLLSRTPTVSADTRADMLRRTQALGYDLGQLKFPAQP